jgi:hypothetical protein
MMNNEPIKRALKHLSEAGVPADTDLWPGIQAQLAVRTGARRAIRKGRFSMNNTLPRLRPARALGISALALMLVLAGLMATTQGRALAASVLQFFSPAPAASFETAPVAPGAGPTAQPPAFTETGCDAADLACQVGAAEDVTGLAAPRLPASTGTLSLRAVEVAADREWLRLIYTAETGGGLALTKSHVPLSGPVWESVPAGAAEAVTVRGYAGEYVRGTFVVGAGSAEAVWNADAPVQRLRWQEDGVIYEIQQMVGSSSDPHFDKDGLIAIGANLP